MRVVHGVLIVDMSDEIVELSPTEWVTISSLIRRRWRRGTQHACPVPGRIAVVLPQTRVTVAHRIHSDRKPAIKPPHR
jgi:hypothetical protein